MSPKVRFITIAFSALFVLAGVSNAQATTSSLNIGGPGALGCAVPAFDPPTLEDGVPASGGIGYSFDATTQILVITVTNTSLVVPGVPNPVISKVYVGLPQFAITGASLVSQTAAGGAVPQFTLGVDIDNIDEVGSLTAACFGKFGLCLEHGNSVTGGIANPLADTLPGAAGTMVLGPVVFTIQLTASSASVAGLVAEAFAHSWSVNNPGDTQSTGSMKFQGGGVTNSGGWIGAAPAAGGGSPAGWVVGAPVGGSTLTLVQSGHPGWEGCFIASLTPGPICIDGTCYPIGADWFAVFGGLIPNLGFLSTTVLVPNPPDAPEIGTITFYAIVALASPDQRVISVSDQFSLAIDF